MNITAADIDRVIADGDEARRECVTDARAGAGADYDNIIRPALLAHRARAANEDQDLATLALAYYWLAWGFPAQGQDVLRNALLARGAKIKEKFAYHYGEHTRADHGTVDRNGHPLPVMTTAPTQEQVVAVIEGACDAVFSSGVHETFIRMSCDEAAAAIIALFVRASAVD